jgi:hypothetical protein
MNSVQQPVAGPRTLDRSANDLDGVLRTFFRAEMPEPWPVLQSPATLSLRREGAVLQHQSLFRSRLALAASLLILVIGQLLVSPMFSGTVHVAADGDRGKFEATLRSESGKLRKPKPASALTKPATTPPAMGEGMGRSERR